MQFRAVSVVVRSGDGALASRVATAGEVASARMPHAGGVAIGWPIGSDYTRPLLSLSPSGPCFSVSLSF